MKRYRVIIDTDSRPWILDTVCDCFGKVYEKDPTYSLGLLQRNHIAFPFIGSQVKEGERVIFESDSIDELYEFLISYCFVKNL